MWGWLMAIALGCLSVYLMFKQYRDFHQAKLEDRLTDVLIELEAAEESTAGVIDVIEAQRRGATRLIRLVPAELTMAVVHSFVKMDRLEREQAAVLADIINSIATAKEQSARKHWLPPTLSEFNRLNFQADRVVQASKKLSDEIESIRLRLLSLAGARATQADSPEHTSRQPVLQATD